MWHFFNPVQIDAGPGAFDGLPELVGNRRAILIAFPEARELGLCDRVQALLGEQLLAIETDIQPNPDVSWLSPLYERLWRDHPDAECIIALGGGSVIDCAKAMLTSTSSGTFAELLDCLSGKVSLSQPPGRVRSLIAVPTTAGTGSEVTPWATIWDKGQGRKYSLHLPWTWPQAAIIDPGPDVQPACRGHLGQRPGRLVPRAGVFVEHQPQSGVRQPGGLGSTPDHPSFAFTDAGSVQPGTACRVGSGRGYGRAGVFQYQNGAGAFPVV